MNLETCWNIHNLLISLILATQLLPEEASDEAFDVILEIPTELISEVASVKEMLLVQRRWREFFAKRFDDQD